MATDPHDFDVDTPEQFPAKLRALADRFRADYSELQSAHQDRNAGRVWSEFAKILDRAATSADKAIRDWV